MDSTIELVGGPLCGSKTKWPHPDLRATLRCPTGYVEYAMEIHKGQKTGKALHVFGDGIVCCEAIPA